MATLTFASMIAWTRNCATWRREQARARARSCAKRCGGNWRSRLEQLRRRVAPFAEAHGWLTDEDVFREVS